MNARLAALDFITGCLGVRRGSEINQTLRSAVVSRRLNWDIVVDIANTQLVTPALWVALRDRGLVESLPADVREYLRELHRLNTLRNQHLREQTIEAVRQLNSIGIEPVLLKGSASLFVRTFDDPGSRVMTDLDILVPARDAENCWNILRRTLRYSPVDNDFDYSHHHHLRPLYRPGDYGAIELHRDLLPKETGRLLPTDLIGRHVEPIKESGVAMAVLAPTYRILHNLLHSALVDRAHARGDISLRSLHELVMMQTVCNERIDWPSIRQWMKRGGASRVLCAFLYLSHRWFGSPLPDRMRPTIGAVAHYARSRLQTRWDWTDEIVDRALWFSAQDLCERYGCNNSFMSLARARTRLAAHLSYKYSSRAFRWVRFQNLLKNHKLMIFIFNDAMLMSSFTF